MQIKKTAAGLRHGKVLAEGIRDGMPIALGYLAVSFALGIAAKNAGLSAFQGFIASFLNLASAGEYAGFALIAEDASYSAVAIVTLVTNARYLLMSCSLSQKFSQGAPLIHRLLVGFAVTDEIFGISIARPGALDPYYNYGAMLVAVPCWSLGTCLGVIAGNILPARIVSALGVALYGMFLAVIIPPARKSRVLFGVVLISFAAGFAADRYIVIPGMTGGIKTVILTVAVSAAAALLFPVGDDGAEGTAKQ